MQKLIPLLLVIALAGGGYALWRSMNAETEPEPQIEEAVNEVEEKPAVVVKPKEDDGGQFSGSFKPQEKQSKAPGFELGPEDTLQGRVLDAVTRDPIANAKVELFKFKFKPQPRNKTGRIRIEFDEETLTSVRTGDDGSFSFSDEVAEQLPGFAMRVRTPGYVTIIKDSVGAGMVVDFLLEKSAVIRGQVVDQRTGNPVAEATVEGNIKRDTSDMHLYTRWRGIAKTDSNGRFELNDVPSGSFNLLIEHPDFEQAFYGQDGSLSVERSGSFEDIFRVVPGLTLDGKVVNAVTGKPIPSAKVSIKELSFMESFRAYTGRFGKFKLRGVKRGTPEIEIIAEGYTKTNVRLPLTEESTSKEIVIPVQPAGFASGIVYDPEGNPVSNADIFVAEDALMLFKIRNFAETKTDSEGRFTIGQLDHGRRYRVVARAEGFVAGNSADFEAISGETVEGNIIQLEGGARVQGRVVDEAGVAVSNALVALDRPPHPAAWFPPALGFGQQQTLTLVTDESGAFEFTALYSGAYTLNADHDDHMPVNAHRFRIGSSNEAINHEFQLKSGHTISGNIVDAFGNPSAGATVEAVLRRGGSRKTRATADEEGNYVIRRLSDRPYRVWAYSENAVAAAVDDVPTDSSEVNFTLQQFGEVVGIARGRDGEPMRQFKVKLEPLDGIERKGARYDASRINQKMIQTHEGFREETITTADGDFRIPKVMPGDYRLTFTSEDYREVVQPLVSVASGNPTSIGTILANVGGRLEGSIMTSGGTPVAAGDVQVILRPGAGTRVDTEIINGQNRRTAGRSNWPGKTGAVGANGIYSIGGLPTGRVDVSLQSSRYCVPGRIEIDLNDSGVTTKDFEVALGGSVHFVVKDEDGEAVPNPALGEVTNRESQDRALVDGRRIFGRGRANGGLHVRKIAPGAYRATLRRTNYESVEVEFDVEPGERVQLEVVMPRLIR